VIRQASEEDIPSIVSLICSEPGMWQKAWSDDVVHRALESSNGLAFVCDENAIQGFVCAHDVGFRGYVSDLVVSAQARGKGIGRCLMQRVQSELAQRGCHLVMADVWHEAMPFYESIGWAQVCSPVKLMKMDLKNAP